MATREEILRLKVEAEGEKDLLKLANGLEQLEVDGKKAETAAGALVAELAKLEKQSRAAAEFERLAATVGKTSAKLLDAKAALEKLNAENAGTEKRTKEVAAAFRAAEKEVKSLEAAQTKQTAALQKSGEALRAAGVDTTKLASEQARLAAESNKAQQSILQQAAALRANAAAAEASAERWKNYSAALKNARERGNELVGNLARVGAAATAAAAAASVYAGAKFFTGGIEDAAAIEQALARIQSAAGLTADELATVQTAIEQAAVAASRDVGDAAIAFEALSREGSTAAEAIGALKPALDFATAANLSAKDAVAALSGALDAFGLSADQTATAADTIAAAALKGGTGIADLTAALAKAGPGARGLGLDLQTTTAALAALAQAGIEGGRAGSAFLKIIDDLADPTSRLSAALTEAGITSRDFGTVLAQLDAKGVGAEKVFNSLGANGSAALRALAQNGGAALTEIRTGLDETAAATARAAAAINDTYTVALANLGRAFEAARVELVQPLLGPLSTELDALSAAIAEFAESPAFAELQGALVDAFKAGADAVKAFAETVDFAELTRSIAQFATDGAASIGQFAADVGGFIDGTVTAFRSLGVALDALQAGIFGLAAAGVKIAELSAQFVAFQTDLLNAVPAIRLAARVMGQDLGDAADGLRLKAEGLGDVFDEFGSRAVNAANSAAQGMDDIAASAARAAPPIDVVGDSLFGAGNAAAEAAPKIDSVAPALDGVAAAAEVAAGKVAGAQDEIRRSGDNLRRSLTEVTDEGVSAFRALQEAIASGASPQQIAALQAKLDAVNAELNAMETAAAGSSTALKNLAVSGEDATGRTERGALKAAQALRELKDAGDQVVDTTDRVGDQLEDAAAKTRSLTVSLSGVSAEYERLILLRSQVKLDAGADPYGQGELENELDRQTAALERQLEATRRQNVEFSSLERRVESLRLQYRYLSEDRIRQLAQEEETLERNRENAARERERDRDPPRPPSPTPQPPQPPPNPNQPRPSGGLSIVVNVNGSIIGSSPSQLAAELARLILPEIRKLEARGF